MDFFGQQDAARRNTRRLVLLFALAVIATVLAIYLAVVVAFHDEMQNAAHEQGRVFWPWNALVLGWVSGLTGAVIAGGSLYKTAALAKGGGESVAALLGGKPLEPGNASPAERRLLNVVEEMALAAGTAVPSVFVLPDEQGINAFAAGLSPNAAVIGVTRGAVERLDRDELQGVIAHELSHVMNGDMRLNLRLIGLLHGILVISLIGLWILRFSGSGSSSSSRDKKGGGGSAALFGLAIYVIGWIGGFFGGLIKSAISRQREFLADAAAVQFTRNPLGIAGALKKIGGLSSGSKLASPNAPQASHLFFGNALQDSHFAWRSTHPPLEERIRRLDPAWDGTYPKLATDEAPKKEKRAKPSRGAERLTDLVTAGTLSPKSAEMAGMVLAGIAEAVPQTAPELQPLAEALGSAAPLTPEQIAATAGQPRPAHVAAAAGLLASLPEALAACAREPMTARAVVLALLCDRDAAVRSRQLERVASSGDDALARELQAALPEADALPSESRLPLVDLAVPALRKLSRPQYTAFRALMDELVRADERLSLFEWALHRVLLRHLDPWFAPKKAPRVTTYALRQLGAPLSQLLSTLAHAGSEDPAAAQTAFATGVSALGDQAPPNLALQPRDACTFGRLDSALDTLATVTPARLRELLTACGATVACDGVVSGAEGELLRAVADALGCPVPPLVASHPRPPVPLPL